MWYSPQNIFELDALKSPAKKLLENLPKVWEVLDRLESFICDTIKPNVAALRKDGDFLTRPYAIFQGETIYGITYKLGDPAKKELLIYKDGELLEDAALVMAGVAVCSDDIEIGPGAVIETGAMLKGPAIIGPFSEVRQGAYVRGSVLSSFHCIIGHTTEAKNTLMLDGAKAGHFAYLGDSVLGRDVNLGAGTKLANLKIYDRPYHFKFGEETILVKRRKFGAIIGDLTELGCNTVTNPGSILGRGCRAFPNSTIRAGYHQEYSVLGF